MIFTSSDRTTPRIKPIGTERLSKMFFLTSKLK